MPRAYAACSGLHQFMSLLGSKRRWLVSFDFGGRIDHYKFCSALRLTVHLLSEGGFVAIFITYKGGRRDALEKSRAIQEAIEQLFSCIFDESTPKWNRIPVRNFLIIIIIIISKLIRRKYLYKYIQMIWFKIGPFQTNLTSWGVSVHWSETIRSKAPQDFIND